MLQTLGYHVVKTQEPEVSISPGLETVLDRDSRMDRQNYHS